MWVRGLKLNAAFLVRNVVKSHPVWVRGLKPIASLFVTNDKNVAPRVGAWIETRNLDNSEGSRASHPVWVRGLKQEIFV